MPFWSDLMKTWELTNSLDPIERRDVNKEIEGAGVN